MPTSARKVRGQSGWSIRIIPPVLSVRSRGDVGIAPYANQRVLPFNGARPILSCVPSTPADKRAAPSPSRRGHELLDFGSAKFFFAFLFDFSLKKEYTIQATGPDSRGWEPKGPR